MSRAAQAVAFLAATSLLQCNRDAAPRDPGPKPAGSTTSSAPAPAPAGASPQERVLVDLVRQLPSCDLDHRGPLLDMGTDTLVGRYGWLRAAPPNLTHVEHDGSTWARMTDRRIDLRFTLLEPTPIFVSARVEGYAARSAAVNIDDQPLGTLTFRRNDIRIATTGTTTLPVDAGLHTLTLRFFGHARDSDAFADLDWIRIGIPDDGDASTYGPPTLRDVISPAAVRGGVPHRAVALRAPGSLRCGLRLPPAAHLRVAVAAQGTGKGRAEVRVLRDNKRPEVVQTIDVEGSEKATWVNVDASPLCSGVCTVELRAVAAPHAGRVLFGDPAIALPAATATPSPPAHVVVIVILNGVERAELPPWGEATGTALPALRDLVANGATFDQHRGPTTVVSAAVSTVLTGVPPATHSVTDAGARLPADVATIAKMAREASVRAAFFTGVPYTFRAFGLATAWEKFVQHSPASGAPATAPIDDAAAWINDVAKNSPDSRVLAVVHARGGHPPWDVTAKELAAAAPPEYGGIIEPRTAAQRIAQLRKHAKRSHAVSDPDRQRILALERYGLAGQDRALGALMAALRNLNLWDQTLLLVTGDVASGASDLFGDGAPLREPLLTLPLYAHFPGGLGAGTRVGEPTELVDLARTSLAALGIGAYSSPFGRDLARILLGLDSGGTSPQVAMLGEQYSARWGDLVLSGKFPKPPELCDLSVDSTCAYNRRETMPLAVGSIFRGIVLHDLASQAKAEKREPASFDTDTVAALNVWGAVE